VSNAAVKYAALVLLLCLGACKGTTAGAPAAQSTTPTTVKPPPKILGIAHMALFVSDLAKARVFYRDFLGFGEPFALPHPDGRDRIAFVKVNEQQYIELFDEPPRNDGRVYHISFYTDDAPAMRDHLAALGLPVAAKVGTGKIGNLQFGVVDPDGHNVEIVQYQPTGWTIRDRGKALPDTRIAARIAHLGVLVGALAPSLKFYGQTLGFQETWRGGPSPRALSWVNMRVPQGRDYLELMLYETLPPPAERGGKNHICLEVPDVARAAAVLERRRARTGYNRPIEVKVGVNRKRQANLFDPDGTRVELMEPDTVDGQPAPPSTAPPPR
jgi:catechol 2,3-dioxygenase-like lactoylglutathione lyase family enzyme